jgi:hypothetical protein
MKKNLLLLSFSALLLFLCACSGGIHIAKRHHMPGFYVDAWIVKNPSASGIETSKITRKKISPVFLASRTKTPALSHGISMPVLRETERKFQVQATRAKSTGITHKQDRRLSANLKNAPVLKQARSSTKDPAPGNSSVMNYVLAGVSIVMAFLSSAAANEGGYEDAAGFFGFLFLIAALAFLINEWVSNSKARKLMAVFGAVFAILGLILGFVFIISEPIIFGLLLMIASFLIIFACSKLVGSKQLNKPKHNEELG